MAHPGVHATLDCTHGKMYENGYPYQRYPYDWQKYPWNTGEYQEMDATKEKDIHTVPVTEINGERIVGFDRPAIKKALEL